jgi:hypothetical protein
MNRARQLATELDHFIEGRRPRCRSEIDTLLLEIRQFLEDQATQTTKYTLRAEVDPTTATQMVLPFEIPPEYLHPERYERVDDPEYNA